MEPRPPLEQARLGHHDAGSESARLVARLRGQLGAPRVVLWLGARLGDVDPRIVPIGRGQLAQRGNRGQRRRLTPGRVLRPGERETDLQIERPQLEERLIERRRAAVLVVHAPVARLDEQLILVRQRRDQVEGPLPLGPGALVLAQLEPRLRQRRARQRLIGVDRQGLLEDPEGAVVVVDAHPRDRLGVAPLQLGAPGICLAGAGIHAERGHRRMIRPCRQHRDAHAGHGQRREPHDEREASYSAAGRRHDRHRRGRRAHAHQDVQHLGRARRPLRRALGQRGA